jgi:hypothetical protein
MPKQATSSNAATSDYLARKRPFSIEKKEQQELYKIVLSSKRHRAKRMYSTDIPRIFKDSR